MAQKVNEPSEIVKAMASSLCLVSDLMGGTASMRAAGTRHLPKWPNEDEESYKCRLAASTLFPAFPETVESLASKPFSKPITVGEDVPPAVQELFANVDLEGRKLDVFAHDGMVEIMAKGFAGILVDVPVRGEGVTTQAQEQEAGIRPYWVLVKKEQILGWRKTKIDGVWKLSMLRILECVEEDDEGFGTKDVEQDRVLTPGAWQTYRKSEKNDEWVLHDEGVTSLSEIPFAAGYGKRLGFMIGMPPLMEVAYLNVKHWQSQSDQDNILHVARVPILAIRGIGDDKFKLTVGAASAVNLGTNPEADLKYVEHTGSAIEAGHQSLEELKDQMRQAGAEFLVVQEVQKTATQQTSEDSVGMCKLQRVAADYQDTLNQALQFTADFLGLEEGGGVKLFSDYGARTLAEASAQLLLNANTAGKISDETLRDELRRRGILSAEVDESTEKSRLEEQGPPPGADLTGGLSE